MRRRGPKDELLPRAGVGGRGEDVGAVAKRRGAGLRRAKARRSGAGFAPNDLVRFRALREYIKIGVGRGAGQRDVRFTAADIVVAAGLERGLSTELICADTGLMTDEVMDSYRRLFW